MKLETERLELALLDARQLRQWTEDMPGLERELDCAYQAEPMDDWFRRIIRGQAEKVEQNPENLCWLSFWLLIRKEDRTVVGSADFKNVPNERGEVEIGYGLGKSFEHNGYMTETVRAMTDWALAREGVVRVTAQTEKDGYASQRVLTRCGFQKDREADTLWWRFPA